MRINKVERINNIIYKAHSDFTYSIRRDKDILRVYIYIENIDANVLINLITNLIKRKHIN